MNLNGTTALVTGANRGLGRHFAQQLLERGAAKVYAAARDPRTIDLPGVVPIALDITDPESVARAAAAAPDVDVLINNAGVSLHQNLVTGDLDKIRRELETNFFGTLNVIRAFTPLRAILNMNSRLSWISYAGAGGYAASKAAQWSLTNTVRLELPDTLVTGVYLSATDTDMMAGWDIPKNDPADVVRQAVDGLEADALEVIADEDTAQAKADLSAEPALAT
ncbi:SDR family oxidoreductase [Solirubrobacter sp. CPCC 204708]|uniref:SDR family oxidoreductase n=1 Tax=Solirubrobacter deserti TaxID=2282478 RepID=A0ABT4RSF7_9ACTN|nr:SDR family oxidoreductase [Solirubrobacter deserti]MBE2319889.1 SDR family oxidoreductase [Solirubrobacter deserti]MDA0141422.1 SDR family oxidoreductase [Solirubrobacter deserti]